MHHGHLNEDSIYPLLWSRTVPYQTAEYEWLWAGCKCFWLQALLLIRVKEWICLPPVLIGSSLANHGCTFTRSLLVCGEAMACSQYQDYQSPCVVLILDESAAGH